jgi:glycosyltransferase involved in cell wall biosynthesis
MLHTTHVSPGENDRHLLALYPHANISAISDYQRLCLTDRPMPTIHHGVDAGQFPFTPEPGDYLCYFGRLTPGKGPLLAIRAARELGMPIRLAGPRNSYFDEQIAPHVDGDRVIYLGPIGGENRARMLGGARALLYPITHPEPFGLVLVEAMMCGTPVAAIGIGAVPEIVDEGITGSVAGSRDDFPDAVLRAQAIDRPGVRRHAESRFSAEVMGRRYAELYAAVVSGRYAG